MSQEKRDCLKLLTQSRRIARKILREMDELHDAARQARRQAKAYRASGNPILIRNAEVMEARLKDDRHERKVLHDILVSVGEGLRVFEDDIDRLIPQAELLDLLEVNPADRHRVAPGDGISAIVFINGLEDSATYRGNDWKDGPLFHALLAYMNHCIKNDRELRRTINGGLFGKGGMFEFLPTYSQAPGGEFIRNPPKLRVADEKIDISRA